RPVGGDVKIVRGPSPILIGGARRIVTPGQGGRRNSIHLDQFAPLSVKFYAEAGLIGRPMEPEAAAGKDARRMRIRLDHLPLPLRYVHLRALRLPQGPRHRAWGRQRSGVRQPSADGRWPKKTGTRTSSGSTTSRNSL